MSQVLQVHEISEILVCHISGFCWLPKVNITHNNQTMENDGNIVVHMISNSMLWYMIEEGEV